MSTARPLDEVALAGVDVPRSPTVADSKWELTVGEDFAAARPPRSPPSRRSWPPGGGLVVLGEEEDKYGGNLNDLLAPFGVRLEHTIGAPDYDPGDGVPSWVVGEAYLALADPGILHRVREVGFIPRRRADRGGPRGRRAAHAPGGRSARRRAGRRDGVQGGPCRGRRRLGSLRRRRPRPATIASRGSTRDRASLAAFRADATPIVEAAQDRAGPRLKRPRPTPRGSWQEPTGEADPHAHDVARVRALVVTMAGALADLAPRFAHEADYLAGGRRPAGLGRGLGAG